MIQQCLKLKVKETSIREVKGFDQITWCTVDRAVTKFQSLDLRLVISLLISEPSGLLKKQPWNTQKSLCTCGTIRESTRLELSVEHLHFLLRNKDLWGVEEKSIGKPEQLDFTLFWMLAPLHYFCSFLQCQLPLQTKTRVFHKFPA